MIYQIHDKFTKRFKKTAGRKRDSKRIFNLLLGRSFSPEEEWQYEAHWNQWEDFQAFHWTLINALREQTAHLFRGHYVNNSGPWIWFMDQDWTRSFWAIMRHTELRAALKVQGCSTAASQSWQHEIHCPSYSYSEGRGYPQCPAPLPISCPIPGAAGRDRTHSTAPSSCNLFCTEGSTWRQAGSCAKHPKGLHLKRHPRSPLQLLKCWGFTAHPNRVPQMQYILILIGSTCYPLCNIRLISPNNYWRFGCQFAPTTFGLSF